MEKLYKQIGLDCAAGVKTCPILEGLGEFMLNVAFASRTRTINILFFFSFFVQLIMHFIYGMFVLRKIATNRWSFS